MYAKRIFDKFDKNKDGKLSLEEFREAAFAFHKTFSDEEIVKLFNELDVDGDGEVLDVNEFSSCIEKMLKEVFTFCDVDGDGKIPADEFYGEKVRVADEDGDGFLCFDEFMALVIGDLL